VDGVCEPLELSLVEQLASNDGGCSISVIRLVRIRTGIDVMLHLLADDFQAGGYTTQTTVEY